MCDFCGIHDEEVSDEDFPGGKWPHKVPHTHTISHGDIVVLAG